MTPTPITSGEPRPFALCDLPGIYQVCARTADQSGQAGPPDADLTGHLYAGAYPLADPGLTWVVRDEQGVAGYLVATDDSARFARWQEEHWWPALRERYPLTGEEGEAAPPPWQVQVIHAGQPSSPELTDRYPAHLHIDLLPSLQGRGVGRLLVETLTAELRSRSVAGLHLSVAETNTGAISFYERVGFRTEVRHPWGRWMVRDLTT